MSEIKDGDRCTVIAGTHKGKSGVARDLNVSRTGHLTVTIVQASGERFKTLARNVRVSAGNR
jgi:ribosomal protein S4E